MPDEREFGFSGVRHEEVVRGVQSPGTRSIAEYENIGYPILVTGWIVNQNRREEKNGIILCRIKRQDVHQQSNEAIGRFVPRQFVHPFPVIDIDQILIDGTSGRRDLENFPDNGHWTTIIILGAHHTAPVQDFGKIEPCLDDMV